MAVGSGAGGEPHLGGGGSDSLPVFEPPANLAHNYPNFPATPTSETSDPAHPQRTTGDFGTPRALRVLGGEG